MAAVDGDCVATVGLEGIGDVGAEVCVGDEDNIGDDDGDGGDDDAGGVDDDAGDLLPAGDDTLSLLDEDCCTPRLAV